MTPAERKSVTFETILSASGNNTGIAVPEDVIKQLGMGKRPPVLVNVNGYEYRSTVAVMGGRHLISLSAADVPDDFAAALEAEEPARRFFDELSNSMQRYHVDNINAAKAPETRRRRIDKAVGLFLEGKQR
jgi:hypothetical protein